MSAMGKTGAAMASILVLAGSLAGCAHGGGDRADGGRGGSGFPFGIGGGGRPPAAAPAGIGVNAFLWRASLDTLSFMPLASADPFGGVVITDWYQPATAGGERFKATAYILGRQLRDDGVRVSVFRQVSQGGQWVDAAVNPSVATELENKVLERARELRSQGGQ